MMSAMETVENALALAYARRGEVPEFEIYASIVAQLEYLLSALQGKESERSRSKKIIVGHFAVREFAETDPELADALIASQYIAHKFSQGLKA